MNYDFQKILQIALPEFFSDLADIQSSEANFSALLYHHLIQSGYTHTQICVEMYSSNLVPDGVRPDLVIFEEEIAGRFNYYQNCDKTRENTSLKKQNIRCLFEVKGGAQQLLSGLSNYAVDDPICESLRHDPDRRNKYQNARLAIDIEKLGRWSEVFGIENHDYIFLAIDIRNPKGFWPVAIRETFGAYAAKHGVRLVYYAQGSDHFWHYDVAGNGNKSPVVLRDEI